MDTRWSRVLPDAGDVLTLSVLVVPKPAGRQAEAATSGSPRTCVDAACLLHTVAEPETVVACADGAGRSGVRRPSCVADPYCLRLAQAGQATTLVPSSIRLRLSAGVADRLPALWGRETPHGGRCRGVRRRDRRGGHVHPGRLGSPGGCPASATRSATPTGPRPAGSPRSRERAGLGFADRRPHTSAGA